MRKLLSALMICTTVALGASSSQQNVEVNIVEGLWNKCVVKTFDKSDPFITTHHEAFEQALSGEHERFMKVIEQMPPEVLRNILAFETMPQREAYQARINELSREIRYNKEFIAETFALQDRLRVKKGGDRWPLLSDTYCIVQQFVLDTALELKSKHLLEMILSFHEDDLDASFVEEYKNLW